MEIGYHPNRDAVSLNMTFASQFLSMILQVNPYAKNLLDVGCGHGTMIETAQQRGLTAFGIDLRGEVGRNRKFAQADARALPFPDDNFDIVTERDVSVDMYQLLKMRPDDVLRMYQEAYRVLRSGGVLFSIPSFDSDIRSFERMGFEIAKNYVMAKIYRKI
jgi:ubiquinone/menaquinone biosynthesis C-methylase UbiE